MASVGGPILREWKKPLDPTMREKAWGTKSATELERKCILLAKNCLQEAEFNAELLSKDLEANKHLELRRLAKESIRELPVGDRSKVLDAFFTALFTGKTPLHGWNRNEQCIKGVLAEVAEEPGVQKYLEACARPGSPPEPPAA